jgi:hypothetical protein
LFGLLTGGTYFAVQVANPEQVGLEIACIVQQTNLDRRRKNEFAKAASARRGWARPGRIHFSYSFGRVGILAWY